MITIRSPNKARHRAFTCLASAVRCPCVQCNGTITQFQTCVPVTAESLHTIYASDPGHVYTGHTHQTYTHPKHSDPVLALFRAVLDLLIHCVFYLIRVYPDAFTLHMFPVAENLLLCDSLSCRSTHYVFSALVNILALLCKLVLEFWSSDVTIDPAVQEKFRENHHTFCLITKNIL